MLFYRPCSGLILTVASKNAVKDTAAETYLKNGIKDYEKYKKFLELNEMINDQDDYYEGIFHVMLIQELKIYATFLGFEMKVKLKYLRISFDANPFDKVTKDKSAKFTDILSVIGGTMGLLSGFSIISGVEILYFGIRIILDALRGKQSKKRRKD